MLSPGLGPVAAPRGSRIGPGTGALLERGPWQQAAFVLGRVAMNRAASSSSTKSLFLRQSGAGKTPRSQSLTAWLDVAPLRGSRGMGTVLQQRCPVLQELGPVLVAPGTPWQQVVSAGPAPSSASGAPAPLPPAVTRANVSGLTLGVPGSALPAQALSSCLTAGELWINSLASGPQVPLSESA